MKTKMTFFQDVILPSENRQTCKKRKIMGSPGNGLLQNLPQFPSKPKYCSKYFAMQRSPENEKFTPLVMKKALHKKCQYCPRLTAFRLKQETGYLNR